MLLQRAINFAIEAHRKMEDPPGEPYILHPLRVMFRFADADADRRVVALLHDTIERAGVTPAQLRRGGIPHRLIKAIQLLTHDDQSTYADYVVKLKANDLARDVKIADLLDNADLRYVDVMAAKPGKSRRRVLRYALSYKFLADKMTERDYRRLMKKAESKKKIKSPAKKGKST